jgi:hypothetical protein
MTYSIGDMVRNGRILFRNNKRLPGKRILITADLEQGALHPHTKATLEMLSRQHASLTAFCPNVSTAGTSIYATVFETREYAEKNQLKIEFASHSMDHTPLPVQDIDRTLDIIHKSVSAFHDEGISVCGFRAPFLSIEGSYREILQEISDRNIAIRYDSSILFEGNRFISRIHDIFTWKSPHLLGNIWELPISCLDDHHVFEKLRMDADSVFKYWTGKMDVYLNKKKYFLLLLHPESHGDQWPLLERIVEFARDEHPDARFVTCCELVDELDKMDKI